MMQSNSKYYVKSTISSTQAAGTTFLLSTDFELGANLETGANSVSMVLKNGTQIERFEITATGGTATIVKRGLTQSQTEATDVALQKQWTDGTIAYVTNLAFDIVDKQGDTMTGPLKFSGTTNEGLVVNSLTTAQRTALTPDNGAIVYDTTLGELFQYIGGAWSAVASGSTQPNASTTVAGKVEEATSAESIAGTQTGGTGAELFVNPLDIAKNTQSGTFVYAASSDVSDTYTANLTPALTAYTTGQRVRVKFTTANTGACTLNLNSLGAKSIKLIDGTDPLDGDIAAGGTYDFIYDGTNMVLQSVAIRASAADVLAGTNTLKFVTPAQMRKGLETVITTMNSTKSAGAGTATSSTFLASKNYMAVFTIAISSADSINQGSTVIQYSLDGSTGWTTMASNTIVSVTGGNTNTVSYTTSVPLLNGIYYRSQSTTSGASCSASVTLSHLVQF